MTAASAARRCGVGSGKNTFDRARRSEFPKRHANSGSAIPYIRGDKADRSSDLNKIPDYEIEIPPTGEKDTTTQDDAEQSKAQSPAHLSSQDPKPSNASPIIKASSLCMGMSPAPDAKVETIWSCDRPTIEFECSEISLAREPHVPDFVSRDCDGPNAERKDADLRSNQSDSDSEYDENPKSRLWRFRMLCGSLVNHTYVQIGIICLIIVNALMMGLATFDFVMENQKVDAVFQTIDSAFLVIFSIECLMQLIYLGVTLFSDGWLVFDLLIVILSWSLESLQIVRAFRIFRAFRLVTRVKPLRDLVLAIGAVMPRMYAIAALLLLIFYIFSVLFTELFSELPLSEAYFTTLDNSLFTCMQMMTLEWGEIAREVLLYEPWAWAPIVAFIMITGFIVFNLIVAVVCDAVSVTEKTSRELEGFEPNSPDEKLADAQERIDLIQCHISEMLKTQENVHNLIELMASELLTLEAERMKAQHREAELRIEMDRRMAYQNEMQSPKQIESLARGYIQEKERRAQERKLRELQQRMSTRAEDGSMSLSWHSLPRQSSSRHSSSRHSSSLHSPMPTERGRASRRGSAASNKSGSMTRRALKRTSSHEPSHGALRDPRDSSKRSIPSQSSDSSFF